MNLHYDYITRHFHDRASMVEALTEAHRLMDITFDEIGQALEQQGLFPAASVTFALMALHNAQGQQTFVLGEHVSSMLEHTSVKDVPKDELRMPYPTFYVALPGCKHRVWGGTRTKWHTVEGIYVHVTPDVLTVMAWAGENERSIGVGDDAHIWARLDMRHKGEDLETMIHRLLTDRCSEKNDPILDPLAIIEGSQDDGITDEVRAVQIDTLTAMFRTAINLSLYLASPEPETAVDGDDPHTQTLRAKLARAKTPGKRKKIERQLANRSKATMIRVGESIEARARAQVDTHGNVSAHWVRGHWHHYWTGAGRTTKVRRWVMPYPKGLEPPTKREYKVAEQPEDSP